jgi:hypothetical protein
MFQKISDFYFNILIQKHFIYDFFFYGIYSPIGSVSLMSLTPINTHQHPHIMDIGEPHLLLSHLVQEEHPMPHHLPPMPPAHSLDLPLPCPVHLLPHYPLPPPIGCTSPTPNIHC